MEKKIASESVSGESSNTKSKFDRLLKYLREKDSEMLIFAKFSPFMLGMVGGPMIEPDPLGTYIDQRIVVLNQYIKMCHKAEASFVDANHKSTVAVLASVIEKERGMLTDLYKDILGQTWVLQESSEPDDVLKEYIRIWKESGTFYENGPIIGAAVAVVSIASSFRLYAHLGNVMKDCLHEDLDKHLYEKWIKHYISQRVQALVGDLEILIEDLYLHSTFNNATFKKFYSESLLQELKLIYSQVPQKDSISPMRNAFKEGNGCNICFEFSKTCIKTDANETFLEKVTKVADKQSYTDHLKNFRFTRHIVLGQRDRKYEDGAVNHRGIELFMKALVRVVANLDPFFQSKLLKGMHEDVIKERTKLKFRDGCLDFFQAFGKKELQGLSIHIISDVLSEYLIRSAFKGAFPRNIYIHSNALIFVDGTATGLFDPKITSPEDKLTTFKSLTCDGTVNRLSVFIGNSIDDFFCLMEANIGIIVELDSMLKRQAERFGVTLVPLYENLVKKQKKGIQDGERINLDDFRDLTVVWKPQLGILYTVSSWTEVQAFLVGV